MEDKKPRQYKKHTLLRRREAKKNNFLALDLAGKFKMLKRQRSPVEAIQLWRTLAKEEQLQFLAENYKGFTVPWRWRERQGLSLSPVKVVTMGYALEVSPKIGKVRFTVDLIHMKEMLNNGDTWEFIRKYLPTVRGIS